MKHRPLPLLLLLIALCLPGSFANQLPTLGDGAELGSNAERRIGDRIAASIYKDPAYINDPLLQDYVQSIWQPLLAAARARGEINLELQERFAWEPMLVRDRTVNAFALPGGYMGIHLGLISVVSTPAEFASVLAHELSHITQRHISRLISKQGQQTPWMMAAMVLGALAMSHSPDAGNALMVGGQAAAAQTQLNFSRDMEREADRVGFGVMLDAGFDGHGFAAMFDKLQQASRLNDSGNFPYLRSHPLTTERIANVQARLQLAPPAKVDDASLRLLHALMAARAKVLVDPGVDALRELVVEANRVIKIVAKSISPRDAGALYGGALAALKLRNPGQAKSLLAHLSAALQFDAHALHVAQLLALELDVASNSVNPGTSLAHFQAASERADLLLYAQALLSGNHAAPAVADRLQTWVSDHPRDTSAWELLAQAYGQQGQSLRAIRADAEGHAAQFDYTGALNRLKAAQDLIRASKAAGGNNYIDGSIIDTRAREFDKLAKEQTLQDKQMP